LYFKKNARKTQEKIIGLIVRDDARLQGCKGGITGGRASKAE
jgi:hypothetical protein